MNPNESEDAIKLFRRIRDYAEVAGESTVTLERAREALDALGLDSMGLERRDRGHARGQRDSERGERAERRVAHGEVPS